MASDLFPARGYSGVIHAVQSVSQVLAHNDGSIDGQLQVTQRVPDQNNHSLHAVNLLPQENVHGLKGTHAHQSLSDLDK